jgi:hypothetical protein
MLTPWSQGKLRAVKLLDGIPSSGDRVETEHTAFEYVLRTLVEGVG